ncbi:MAG: hypothetical protein NWP83_09255 [Spirosomaceae bacterium]|nr:hypothetical protein [Spirosomataceae bacterium]
MDTKSVMEVTTFSIKSDANSKTFAELDAKVESGFTSKQPGFIVRQSGVDEKGNYVVVVYWNSLADADSSMSKFMKDTSVAGYAQMIEGSTMKMSRYTVEKPFSAVGSQFVEIMTFDINKDTDLAKFNATNQKVETDFTGKRDGFLQRLTGVNEEGKQVVAVYWASKETSDASLEPFMAAPIAKEFMADMNQSTMRMGRYELLN